MRISGLSGKSNGVACLLLKNNSEVAKDYSELNKDANIRRQEWSPDLPVMSAVVADSYLQARARTYFPRTLNCRWIAKSFYRNAFES